MKRNIYYIPGLGADIRLFEPMLPYLPGNEIKWPDDLGRNLEQLAKRIIEVNKIKKDDIIIGFSFGAQIAKEIKLQLDGIKAVSISSVYNSQELTTSFKFLTKIIQYIPNIILKLLLKVSGVAHASKYDSKLKAEHIKLLKEMNKDLDVIFFKKTAKLCANWKNNKAADILKINGENDFIIPYIPYKDSIILQDAGHLITYTHSELIVQEIKKYANIT